MNKTKLRIHTWPEPILKKHCKTVDIVDDSVQKILQEMYLLMIATDGVGLAANQVGIDLQLVVIEFNGRILKLVNPEIIKREGAITNTEGCLSFPGLELKIRRNQTIWLTALDEYGAPVHLELDSFLAIIAQHEIDHIQGIPFFKRVSWLKQLLLIPRLHAIARKTNKGKNRELPKQRTKS